MSLNIEYSSFIQDLKKIQPAWEDFINQCCNAEKLDYESFHENVYNFLKLKNFYIIHNYDHETLKLQYIVYHNNRIIDIDEKIGFGNEYYNIILKCFKLLNNGN